MISVPSINLGPFENTKVLLMMFCCIFQQGPPVDSGWVHCKALAKMMLEF